MQMRDQWLSKIATQSRAAADAGLFEQLHGPRALRADPGRWKIITPLTDDFEGIDGLVISDLGDVARLRDMPLHHLNLHNEGGDETAMALADLISELPLDPALLHISFGVKDFEIARRLHDQGFKGPFFNETENALGDILIGAARNLRLIDFMINQDKGVATSVTLSATENMFSTIAKFRATRILWSKLLLALKLPETPIELHGVIDSSLYHNAVSEHFMMGAVSAVMGAGLGGANSIFVQPFSESELDVRMARNIQIIMQQESHLWRVNDPAAGAGYVEHLTQKLCTEAWDTLQKSEHVE